MSRKRRLYQPKGLLELMDEAVHLLRQAPVTILGCYYFGSAPFILGLLYFWADMSRSAFAEERCAPASFGLALLFLWMKTWQAEFAQRLKSSITSEPELPWTPAKFARQLIVQAAIQPSGLFLLPLALLITLPFGWVYAFYQNVVILGGAESLHVKSVFKRALRQAELWPSQNHLLLLLLFSFGLFIFLNLVLAAIFAPQLIRIFSGVELFFAKSRDSIFNTTFLLAASGVTYLCLDPLIKAVYVLRCFYGESLHSGEDLKSELKYNLAGQKAAVTTAIIFVCCTCAGFGAGTPEKKSSANVPATAAEVPISPTQLDRSISETINQREYSWRLPRKKTLTDADRPTGLIESFIDGIVATLKGWGRSIGELLNKVFQWLGEVFRRWFETGPAPPSSNLKWLKVSQYVLFTLLVVTASVAGVLFWRAWKRRQKPGEAILAEAVPVIPDLADETVLANQLPEDDWLRLARELVEKGELRRALRALFLASLAHLAQREMITLAQFKSNREYERELVRRVRGLPELQTAFAQNVLIYDSVWYGMHEVSQEIVNQFKNNLERIKAC